MTAFRSPAPPERVVEVDVTALGSGGEGIASHEGERLFVDGALPGERWRVGLRGRERNVTAIELMQASPGRVKPHCELFGTCGGCAWQHAAPEIQQAARIELLRRALPPALRQRELGHTASNESYGFRGRARLTWHAAPNAFTLGFHMRRSHEAVDVVSCPVLDPRLDAALAPLRRVLAADAGMGEVAMVTGRRAAIVSLHPSGERKSPAWFSWPDALVRDGLEGALLWVPGASVPAVAGERVGVMDGADGDALDVDPDGFAQAHGMLNTALVRHAVAESHAQDKTVLELFAGVGNFTVALARVARRVVAVESDARSTQLMLRSLARRGLDNVSVLCADAESEVAKRKADVLVLDPPRAGAREVCEFLAMQKTVARIVYVSCDPSSLGRDLGLLSPSYDVRSMHLFEMFPHAPHVETVVQLTRRRRGP